jgi:hypothetical protein
MGLGRQLCGAIETRMRRSLVENLPLWVFEKNALARRFYEVSGYRLETGMQHEMRFAEAGLAMVRYRKIL